MIFALLWFFGAMVWCGCAMRSFARGQYGFAALETVVCAMSLYFGSLSLVSP